MSDRTIVVGGGIMGLAAAWSLARRGARPVVLERFERGHTRGASHGETRNFNNAYSEDHYLDLLERAREGWDALGEVEGEPVLRLHGIVSHGANRPGSPAADRLVATEARLRDRGIAAELLTGAEAARRWPGMRFEETVLHSSDAGVARAAAALRELERRIVAVFAIHGAFAGLATILFATQLQVIQSTVPPNLELTVITAAVIGGVSILGGTGTVIGSTLATILFATIGSALIFVNVSAYWLRAVIGLLILATVLVDMLRRHRRT